MAIYLECLYCMYVHTTRIDSADDDRLELRTVSSCHARWTMLDVGCRFGLHRMNGAPLFMGKPGNARTGACGKHERGLERCEI
jgi:hypothetical protein